MVNFNPKNEGYIVRWQSDIVYSIETILPVCDKPYHMNNLFQQMWAEIKFLWNHAYIWQRLSKYVKLPVHANPFTGERGFYNTKYVNKNNPDLETKTKKPSSPKTQSKTGTFNEKLQFTYIDIHNVVDMIMWL